MRRVVGFLDEQRARLEELREHLVRRTEKVDRDLAREGDFERDAEEQAIERENDDVLVGLAREGRDQLGLVDAALERIEKKTYGRCDRCKKPIALARLKARPYATTCFRCADLALLD